jgi:uncharacterized protein (DUF1778 family)
MSESNEHVTIIPADKWDEFIEWLEALPEDVPGLRKLMSTPLPWETEES